jgi:hypothetical protein
MKTVIVAFYIECEDQAILERVLSREGCAFLDATNYDPYTKLGSNFHTLESIEADLECK